MINAADLTEKKETASQRCLSDTWSLVELRHLKHFQWSRFGLTCSMRHHSRSRPFHWKVFSLKARLDSFRIFHRLSRPFQTENLAVRNQELRTKLRSKTFQPQAQNAFHWCFPLTLANVAGTRWMSNLRLIELQHWRDRKHQHLRGYGEQAEF